MHVRRTAVSVALALLVTACGGARDVPGDAAAVVEGREIPLELVETLVRANAADPGQPLTQPASDQFASIASTQRELLSQLIQDAIVADAATELGIEVSEQQIEERFQEFAGQFGGPEGLREEIARRGRTEADVRDQLAAIIRSELLSERFREEAAVSEDEARATYEQRLDANYRVADVSHILVESEEEAEEIAAAVRGGADFAELARTRSIDEVSAVSGGSLGENPRGRFVEAFDEAVWTAQPGEIVGPVQTEFGYHIIRVNAMRTVPFEDVRAEIEQELASSAAQASFNEWFQQVLRDADVRVDPRFGRWDSAQGVVVDDEALPPLQPESGSQTPAG